MSAKRYTDEFKVEAVRQVIDRGFKVAEVAERPGVTTHSLYAWLRKFGKPGVVQRAELDQGVEVRRLKAELRRVTEERDSVVGGSGGANPHPGAWSTRTKGWSTPAMTAMAWSAT